MRPWQIMIASLFGGWAVWTAFKTIKRDALFTDWLNAAPCWILCGLIVVFLVLNIRQFLHEKKLLAFTPLVFCVACLVLIGWQERKRAALDNSETLFLATTYDIGSDGGLILDFKVNGHVKAEKRDHWVVTYYWGDYIQHQDTINMMINFDFKLPKQAVLSQGYLHFLGDTARFTVSGL